jgi:pre-rRNA-processing protein TSR4
MSHSGDDSDVENEVDLEWLLGFVDPPRHASDLLRHRFPSKVGGRPAWLDPLHLPTRDQLTCPATGHLMQFLIQVKYRLYSLIL